MSILSNNISLRDLYIEEQLVSIPKESLNRKYFKDQRKNYPRKLLTVSLMSYIGGCFFGVIMLAFSMLGTARFEQSMASISSESYYKDTTEFKKAMKVVRN
jgi:preprotein translocase subunit SecY